MKKKSTPSPLRLTIAIAGTLLLAVLMVCLLTRYITPIIGVAAVLMPVWLMGLLCLWCTTV